MMFDVAHKSPAMLPQARPRESPRTAADAVQNAIALGLGSASQPLEYASIRRWPARADVDLTRVRVHTDERAATAARLLGARAFTVGRHVVFAAGQYCPDTRRGQTLLDHELAHVEQQHGVEAAPMSVDLQSDPGLEEQADGGLGAVAALTRPTLQRQASADEAYELVLQYPGGVVERYHALAPAASLAVLGRFAGRIDAHIYGGVEGHTYLHQLHRDQWIVAGISDLFGGASLPPLTIWDRPRSLLEAARDVIAAGHVHEAAQALVDAAAATHAAERRVYEYREGTIAGADRAVFGLQVVQVASTTVVTVGTGGTAGVVLGAALTGVQRLAGDAEAVHLGLQQEIDWGGIAFDTVAALILGRFAGRLGGAVAGRLAARLGSRVAAQAITAILVGRGSGIAHAIVREVFDAARGRTRLTLEQLMDRVADQLSLRATFLDLVGAAAGAATEARRPTTAPTEPSPRSTVLRGTPQLRVLSGESPGPVRVVNGLVVRSTSAGAVGSGPTTHGNLAVAYAPEAVPAPRPQPQPVMAPEATASPAATPTSWSSSSAAVGIAAAAGPAGATSSQPLQVRLVLPAQKALHAGLYGQLVRERRLEHTPGLPRRTAQVSRWRSALRPGGAMQMSLPAWVGLGRHGVSEARRLRPNWTWNSPRIAMEVDHRVEWQLLGPADQSWGDSMINYELLDDASNGTSGPQLQQNIAKERQRLVTVTGNPAWLTQRMVFTQLVLGAGGASGERWLPEQIEAGEHYQAYLQHERGRFR